MEEAIRVEHLSVAIGKKEILHDIHMEIPKGGIISIIGPNGCGKSTLLKAMSRMLQPKEGHVYIYGKDIRSFGRKELARQIAVLPQIHQAPSDVTVEDLVQMGRFPYRTLYRSFSAEDARYVDKALYAVQMHTRKNELVQHLSGGEQQRVWLAVLLAQRSSILFLDEPTTYLDIQHQLRMMKLLGHINEKLGLTIVIVLHDMNQALQYTNYVIAMNEGRIVAAGQPQDVITPQLIQSVFHVHADIVTTQSGQQAIVPVGLDKEGQYGRLHHKRR